MSQCPACLSHNPGSAAFCGHCGTNLRRLASKSGPAWRYFFAALAVSVLLIVLTWIVGIAYRSPEEQSGRTESGSRRTSEASRDNSGGGGGGAADKRTESVPREPRLPTPHEVVSKVTAALVVCDLRDRENRPWKQVRGLLVDTSGVVLCRYTPLLGAYGGTCRLGTRTRARVEISGLLFRDEDLDLALLRLRAAPTDYPSVPLLSEAPWTVLSVGDPVYVFSDYKPVRSTVGQAYLRDLQGRERLALAEQPSLPAESFCALDAYGFVVGLCAPLDDVESGPAQMVVDPSVGLVSSLDAPVLFSLRDLTSASFEGTFQDLAQRGQEAFSSKDWSGAIENLEAALERVPYDEPSDIEVERIRTRLLEAYLAETERLHQDGDIAGAGRIAEVGLARYGETPKLWLCLGEWQLVENQFSDSISALLQAQELESSREVAVLLESAYLQLYEETSQRGDEKAIEAVLLEAIERVPDSGAIRLELAELYYRLGAFDEASRLAVDVPRLNSTLRGAAEDLQKRVERELNARDAVVIPISSGSASYRTAASIDGALSVSFIIDTGATSTTLPRRVIEQLGYDLRNAQFVRVRTAAGLIDAPIVHIASLDVEGYVVRNLQVLVLPDSTPPLLGLNFLKYFRYTVDATRREFRLERP